MSSRQKKTINKERYSYSVMSDEELEGLHFDVLEVPQSSKILDTRTIDDFKINDTTETANIVLTISSHWGQFEKTSGRQTSSNSQQRFFSGDLGMEFTALTVRDIKWGRT